MEMQPEAENIKRSALSRVKKTSGAKSCWRNEEQQDCDSVEQQSSVQDPGAHMLNSTVTQSTLGGTFTANGITRQTVQVGSNSLSGTILRFPNFVHVVVIARQNTLMNSRRSKEISNEKNRWRTPSWIGHARIWPNRIWPKPHLAKKIRIWPGHVHDRISHLARIGVLSV